MTCRASSSATTARNAASTPSSPSTDASDAALDKLALIVRAADCGAPQLAKESHGLLAISKGLSLNFADDHTMLKHGMVIYDALYAWCADTPLQQIGRFLGMK
jgi:hypothetical protein